MKTVWRSTSGDHNIKASVGVWLGIGALALAPLAAGIGLLTIRHYSMRDMEAAKNWVETPCVIEKNEWLSDDEGRSLDLVYRYEFDGQTHQGDRLDTIIGSMGDDDVFEQQMHESFPPGAQAVCYVDPDDPANSVFDREHGADAPRRMWLLAFPFVSVGLLFSLALIGAFVGSWKKPDTETDPPPLPLTTSPGSPPRRVPIRTQAVVLAGPSSSQLAWLFFVGFTYVFIILDGPAVFARHFDLWPNEMTVTGRVTDVREQDSRELGQTTYQYVFTYEVDGQTYTNSSYTRGRKHNEGDEVTITYEPDAPDKGTIGGARSSSIPGWLCLIPFGILLLLALGLGGNYIHNIRTLWLLKRGQVTTASWVAPMLTQLNLENDSRGTSDAGDIPSMISNFQFEVGGRPFKAKKFSPDKKFHRRSKSRAREQQADSADHEVTVLYDPNRPKRNVILSGALTETINNCRTAGDYIMHCAPAPLALILLAVLFHYASAN